STSVVGTTAWAASAWTAMRAACRRGLSAPWRSPAIAIARAPTPTGPGGASSAGPRPRHDLRSPAVLPGHCVIHPMRAGALAPLCRLHDPQRIVPLPQQFGFAGLGLVQVRFLDVAVAADLLGDAGDLGREADVAAVEPVQQPADGALVVVDQLALHAPLGGAAEHVERATAQEPQLRQQAEGLQHPRAVLALDQFALLVAPGQQRRGEV